MRITTSLVALTVVCMPTLVCHAESATKQPPGLSVKQGVLVLRGRPCSGVGVNYFSLFYRRLKKPSDTSYQKGLEQLSGAGIPFVRFMACGFWPVDWDLSTKRRTSSFSMAWSNRRRRRRSV